MKIKRANIYGFGKWVDHIIEIPEDRLVCLYGENESGKSTLQQFFMFMLFGFPPKERKFYRPKTSSRMGGQLIVEDDEIGVYTVERMDGVRNGAAKCILPNGEERDEAWLQKRLNGMNETIYEAIFSFSAHDLVAIKDMKDEELGEILLNIGLTGYRNIYEIEKQLNRELEELFKPYGTRPTINEQVNLLDEQNQKLTEMKNELTNYRAQQESFDTLQNDLQQLRNALSAEQKQLKLINKQINNFNTIYDYFLYIRQLTKLPKNIPFPEQGIERLKMIQEHLLPLHGERSAFIENEKNLLTSLEEAKQQLLQPEDYEKGKELIQLERDYERNEDEITQCHRTIEKLNLDITSKLDQLQIGIEHEELGELTFPFHIEQQWNTCKQQLERINREKEYVDEQYESFQKKKQHFLSECNKLKNQLLDENTKKEYEEKINEYKTITEQEHIIKEANEKRHQWHTLQQKKEREQNIVLLISVLLAIVSGGMAYLINIPSLYYVTAFLIVIGLGQSIIGKRSLRETEQLLILESDTTKMGEHLKITAQEKEQIKHLLKEDQNAQIAIQTIEKDLHQTKINILELNERMTKLEEDEKKLDKKVNDQIMIYPFLTEVNVTYWPGLFHTVRHLVSMIKEAKQLSEQMNIITQDQVEIEEHLTTYLQKHNLPTRALTVSEKFQRINEHILDYENKIRQINDTQEELDHNIQKQQDLTKKIDIYQKEKHMLFSTAKVETEEEFYQQANTYAEKQQIENALLRAQEQLKMVFSEEEMAELHNVHLEEHVLKEKKHDITENIQRIETKIEEKRETQAKLFAVLQRMESSETYSETLHRFSMEKDRLNELALNWSVLKTASEILTETKRTYQSDYLAKIIDQMTTYFSKITDGAYVNVYAPTKDRPFQVQSATGIRYKVNELSQGTIDQLYISLRIAMGELVSEQHNIPFIIDDAFVHFDSNRLQRMINIVTAISKKQQIVIFTCKQEVVNCFPHKYVVSLDQLPTVRIN